MLPSIPFYLAVAAMTPLASAHIAFWHKSMFGFNVTMETFPYDNRPQAPLQDYTFQQWWFHNHLNYPPNGGDYFELPARGTVNTELSCDKGSTSWYASSQGGNAGYGTNSPCVGQPTSEFHTTGFNDVKGCALAIAYKSDARDVQPEDFTVFSVNHTCVWYLNTAFQVPDLPACPPEGCICAWFWVHSPDSGSEQNYMNGFRCKVAGASSTKAVGKPAVARRCGADPANGVQQATPSNCTVGPKQPFYWYQKERNNMFEGTYSPPFYQDLYNFKDGAQTDIFQAATVGGVPVFPGSGPVDVPSSPSPSSSKATPSSTPAAASPSSAPAPAAPPSKSPAGGSSGSSSQAPAPGPSSSKASSPVPTPAAAAAKGPKPAPSPGAPAPSPSASAAPAAVNPHPNAAPAAAPAPTKKCKPRSGNKRRSDNIKRHLKKRLMRDHTLH